MKIAGRILVAEDEDGVRSFLAEALELDGHDVVAVADGDAALRALRDGDVELVITDLRMPGADGMTVVRAARTEQPDVEVIVLTAFGAVASAVEAMKLGAFDYLEKPLSGPQAIRELAKQALQRRASLVGQRQPPANVDGKQPLTSRSPAMRGVIDALQKVARANATVLLTGESGTGKEVAARALHAASARAAAPFMAINCAVLSETLIESELFGHEKGAFTGAHAQRKGRLELADGGSFFLDEVGELHPALQAKLLRVIEERSFERVGGSKPITVDVRLIAATHRDLKAMVRDGKFRDDLYHRLAVFPVALPPLRDRREDILPLAELILAQLATASAQPPARLSDEAATLLVAAPWPGNIRELRNALERAVILAAGGPLRGEHFALDLPSPSAESPRGATLEELEQDAIVKALAAVAGNRRDAAARLGIGLRTLYDKLKRYHIR